MMYPVPRVILLIILACSCPVLFGMDSDDALKATILRMRDLLFPDPIPAIARSAALSLEPSRQEIKAPAAGQASEIQTIDCLKASDFVSYFATLKNGDVITAEFFKEGPFKGEYHCTRGDIIDNILISRYTYHYLAGIYKKIHGQ